LSQLRPQALIRPTLLFFLVGLLALLLLQPGRAEAAEVLQVQGPRLVRIGDRNRSYGVELACISVEPASEAEALLWLRQALPRGSRVNLHPLGDHDGLLMARVNRLESGDDVADGLIAAGLASPAPCP
jgi:endonuclease YncB( thermonuclease family)